MDVGLNSEQLSLRDTVRDILRTECPPDSARQAMTDPELWRTLWKTVVDLGWTELAAPETGDYGPVELAVVLEECGAAIAPIPLLSSVGLAAGAQRHLRPPGHPRPRLTIRDPRRLPASDDRPTSRSRAGRSSCRPNARADGPL